MKILIVCSGNVGYFNFKIHQAFIYEQIKAIEKYHEIIYDTFFIKGKGLIGYIKNLLPLRVKIKNYKPDLIHAHFGLSGILANLQRAVPVVTTLHGSDLNIKSNRKYSLLARYLSKATIIVSPKMMDGIRSRKNDYIIPCGIDFELFYPMNKIQCRRQLNLSHGKKYILFSSSFDNIIKNFPLAEKALSLIDIDCELIELKNRSRKEVNTFLNAVDLLLLTSFSEGSPQIVKEAMACNCPIVATDLGDIREVIGDTDGCYITSFDPQEIAEKIKLAINFSINRNRTNGREKIKRFDNQIISEKIFTLYKGVVNENM